MTKTWTFPSAALLLIELTLFKYSINALSSLPELLQTSTGKDIVLDGQDTVWQVDSQPLNASSAAQSVTLRRATLQGAKLLVPKPTAPLALSTSGFFSGLWTLEDLYIQTTCLELAAFADLACGVQPATWISSSGWSVRINSFTPSGSINGTFAISNVTLICNPATEQSVTGAVEQAACVTVTADNSAELLALLSYNDTLYGRPLPPPTSHLYIACTSNISLDGDAWAAAPPMIYRAKTTIAGDPINVTAIDLVGRASLMNVNGGAILRMVNLELVNLATDTLNNMPRGLASGAVWAVKVDIPNGSRLWLENCTLVLTPNEFVWQSYYMAQALANTAISDSVSSYLPVFQGSMSPSELRWRNVSSPHTLWLECRMVVAPRVYNVTIPNSFLTQYLGLTLYLTDLHMVYTCNALLEAVRTASSSSGTTSRYVTSGSPVHYAIVLGANISLADCWPVGEGVSVAAPAVTLMGLPDHTTILDLAGRTDALILAPSTILSIRYLTLIGLAVHGVDVDDGAGATISASSGSTNVEELGLATALLWAFHFPRWGLQLQLERATLVLPYPELEQYETMYGSADETLPYFQGLKSYLTASSSLQGANAPPPPSNFKIDSAVFSKSVPKLTLDDSSFDSTPTSSEQGQLRLSFQVLILPGFRGTQVDFTSWTGEYGNWSSSMYYLPRDEGHVWLPWQIAALSVCVSLAALTVLTAAVLYDIRRKRLVGGGIGGRRGFGPCWQYPKRSRQHGDIEGGGDGVCGGGNGQAGTTPTASAGGGSANGGHGQAQRRPLYDSFDDPVFELDLVKDRSKLTPDDVADILERANMEAAEFNLQLMEICGSGSFGVVYGGIWHGIKVAVKTMVFSESPPQQVGGQVARQQCIREAAFCCTMHHPNVVTTHHFYLKSAKRATMFDDLQQVDDSSSEDEPFQRRPRRNRLVGGEAGADPFTRPPWRRARRPRPPVVKPAVTHWRLYLIQEYCDGGTLRQAVDQGILFKPDGAARAAEAAAIPHGAPTAPTSKKARKLTAQSCIEQFQPCARGAHVNLYNSSERASNSPIESLIPDLQHVLARCVNSGLAPPQLTPPSVPSQRLRTSTTVDTASNTADSNAIATTTSNCTDGRDHVTAANAATVAGMEPPQLVQMPPATALVPLPLPRPGGGGRLADVGLAASGPEEALPEELSPIIHTALGVASGVAYLHSRSIIHGDLSANNVLLVKTQVPALPLVAKLSDFGLSMRLEKGQDHLKNVHHGTPYYQSPEVVEQGTCSLAADVYSLGVLLWELYHGPPPWRAKKHKVHKRPCLADITIPSEILALASPEAAAEIQLEQEQRRARKQQQKEHQQESTQQRDRCEPRPQEGTLEQSSSRQQQQQQQHENGVEVPTSGSAREPMEKEPVNEQGEVAVGMEEEDLWDDPYYRLRACDVLQIAPHCPERYAALIRRCLSPDPQGRPSARSVVKSLLRMERGLTAAALAAVGIRATSAGAPVGAVMALSKPHTHVPVGMSRDAALLLEDFDVAAAAVSQALARVTAEPAVAGAPASAGATAAASRAMCSAIGGSTLLGRTTELRWLATNGGNKARLPEGDTEASVASAQVPAAAESAEGILATETSKKTVGLPLTALSNGDVLTLE